MNDYNNRDEIIVDAIKKFVIDELKSELSRCGLCVNENKVEFSKKLTIVIQETHPQV